MSNARTLSNSSPKTSSAAPAIVAIGDGWLLAGDPTRKEQLQQLWAMTVSERVSAMRAGALSRDQLFAWVARWPDQCPVVNGEWEFIAATMADLDPD